MRVALAKTWPALSYHFGLHPWDLDRLTPLELSEYLRSLEEISNELRK